MKYILDTCVLGFVPLDTVEQRDFMTTSSIIDETVKWKKAEKKQEKWDPHLRKYRPGYVYAIKRTQKKLEELLSRYNIELDEFCRGLGEFDNSIELQKYFSENPDLVWDDEIPESLNRFKGLLTKTIAYHACNANLLLVSRYSQRNTTPHQELTDIAFRMYEQRFNEFFGRLIDPEYKRKMLARKVGDICFEASRNTNVRRSVNKFRNGVSADLSLIACANSIGEAAIVSRDLDLRELVKYTNLVYGNPVKVLNITELKQDCMGEQHTPELSEHSF